MTTNQISLAPDASVTTEPGISDPTEAAAAAAIEAVSVLGPEDPTRVAVEALAAAITPGGNPT